MLLSLDTPLIRKIALMASNRALLSTCKEILNATTLRDRTLMAVRETKLDPNTALMKAVAAGVNVGTIEFLLDHAWVDESLSLDSTFIIACKHGHLHIVQHLMDAGADVHAKDHTGFLLACSSGHDAVVQFLLDAGADVSIRDCEALMLACMYGHLAVVERLLEAGADVHAQYNKPLLRAYLNGHHEIIKCLLEAGAYMHPPNNMVIMYAKRYPTKLKLLQAAEKAEAILRGR
jgi:ankyrin repeat protein